MGMVFFDNGEPGKKSKLGKQQQQPQGKSGNLDLLRELSSMSRKVQLLRASALLADPVAQLDAALLSGRRGSLPTDLSVQSFAAMR